MTLSCSQPAAQACVEGCHRGLPGRVGCRVGTGPALVQLWGSGQQPPLGRVLPLVLRGASAGRIALTWCFSSLQTDGWDFTLKTGRTLRDIEG